MAAVNLSSLAEALRCGHAWLSTSLKLGLCSEPWTSGCVFSSRAGPVKSAFKFSSVYSDTSF